MKLAVTVQDSFRPASSGFVHLQRIIPSGWYIDQLIKLAGADSPVTNGPLTFGPCIDFPFMFSYVRP
jgi:hypothetical protein